MADLLDWWTVPGARWGVRNLDFKVELRRDGVIRVWDLSEYGEAELAAFDGGDWQFAVLRVVPVDRDLTDLIGAQQHLAGVEWGQLGESRIDREDVTDAQARELALIAVGVLRHRGMNVDTERDSPFSLQSMSAPF
jgi:hypothetical protein